MTIAFALAGDLLLQSAAGIRDTVITKQVVADRGMLEQITAAASAIMTIALLALTIVAIPVAWRLRNTYRKVDHLLERIHDDVTPIMANAHDISDNINYITTSIRADVATLNATLASANERLQQAIAVSERRVNDFNALLALVQEEAEGLFVTTASTVRGVRRGTSAFQEPGFRDRRGMDLASEELDAAEGAGDLDIQEETDGYDRRTESTPDPGPAAPRVRPRPQSRRA
jgi:uncharacterized protein YoxC